MVQTIEEPSTSEPSTSTTTTDTETSASPWPTVVRVVGPMLLVPVVGFVVFGSTGRDDNYISYFAAWSLAETGEILNYNGDRVEQSSSLLHTVVLGGLGFITGASIPTLGLVVGILAACGAVALAGVLAERILGGTRVVAGVLCALSTPLLYWAFGGLETTLAALTLASVVYVGARFLVAPSVRPRDVAGVVAVIGLNSAVRPEAWIVLSVALGFFIVLAWFWLREDRRRLCMRATVMLGTNVALAAILALLRLAYFGLPVPQPVAAKASQPDVERVHDGVLYFFDTFGTIGTAVLTFLAAYGAYHWVKRRDVTASLAATTVIAGISFLVLTGGDWMELGRFAAPVVPLLAALAAVGIGALDHRRFVAGVAVAALCGTLLLAVDQVSSGVPLWTSPRWVGEAPTARQWSWVETHNKIHRRDIPASEFLNDAVASINAVTGERVRVSSGQAGMVAYYLAVENGDIIHFTDHNSLATAEFEECPEVLNEPQIGGTPARLGPWGRGRPVCGKQPPDVVFGLGPAPPALWSDGYTRVFQSRGSVRGPRLFGGGAPGGEQWIVVRNELVGQIDGLEPV